MEIFLDKQTVRHLRLVATDSIEDEDFDALREDLLELFSEDEAEEIELRSDVEIYTFVAALMDEWDKEDTDDLFDLLEANLGELDIELKYELPEISGDDDDDDDDDFDDDDDYM